MRAVPGRRASVEFTPMQMRVVLNGQPTTVSICHVYAAVIPGIEKSQVRHAEFHRLLKEAVDAALPRSAATSSSGTRATVSAPARSCWRTSRGDATPAARS
jgi:hypothetical protein